MTRRSRIDGSGPWHASRRGAASFLVLACIVLTALCVVFTVALLGTTATASASSGGVDSERVFGESVSDLLRAELVSDLEQSGLSVSQWHDEVRRAARWSPETGRSYGGFLGAEARVLRVSPPEETLWIDVVGEVVDERGRDTRVIQRVSFGSPKATKLDSSVGERTLLFLERGGDSSE